MKTAATCLAYLGRKYRDRVTGFSGIAATVSFDLYGCVQVWLTPPVNEKGECPVGRWFDIDRLTCVDEVPVMDQPAFVERAAARQPIDTAKGPEAKSAPRQ